MRTSLLRTSLALLLVLSLLCLTTLATAEGDSNSASSAATPAVAAVDDEVELDVADSLPDVPAAPASKDPNTPPSKNAEPISLNRNDFCRACYSVVEEFHKCQSWQQLKVPSSVKCSD
jgi:hypothetical protein